MALKKTQQSLFDKIGETYEKTHEEIAWTK